VINAIKFSIEEIEASDQYFDHTGSPRAAAQLADRGDWPRAYRTWHPPHWNRLHGAFPHLEPEKLTLGDLE
jgi:hypothetical protein